ncbi:hypothetical protein BOX15_Mlig026151g1 [Macrostomum lignano]|uniref:CTCK domain-containing protein n=2 Tax=Macrostomum lignano TaxID=282301 RepID=A0A1I8HEA9_9PLAT|nr:hypothetical protein BOX15_Mlig026151g1 [Macrostomum lignano]
MRYLLAFCLVTAMMLGASSLPMEVVKAQVHLRPATSVADRVDQPQEQKKKNIMTPVRKKKVLNLPSKGMQIVLMPWKCYNQSSCELKPNCTTSGGSTVCTRKCYACNSCMQPKITRQKLPDGKVKETRKSYVRTHRCGNCISKSECSSPPCPMPKLCTLHRG